ncbi:hypothetical protein ACZ90_27475 [Streptomyces albus subsp. albus]|nr:hypothetical protein ACZ90_27475 [Streptomyces albus subsp. albus]
MGSLRNPIGPLPSSIYWRRRAVAVLLVALLAMLVVWALGLGGSGGGKKDDSKGTGSGGAASTITPGPSSTAPVHSGRPGGRDEASPGTGGDDDTGGNGADGGSGGSGGAGQGIGSGDGPIVPAGSALPDCRAGAVELTVRSVKKGKVKNDYAPGEKPTFELVVKNSSVTACKVDFGHGSASLTITNGDNKHVWSTADCPKGAAVAYIEVPGRGETTRSVEWDRKRSTENCAKPTGSASAGPDTYLVEAKVGHLAAAQVSFVLKKD